MASCKDSYANLSGIFQKNVKISIAFFLKEYFTNYDLTNKKSLDLHMHTLRL